LSTVLDYIQRDNSVILHVEVAKFMRSLKKQTRMPR